MDQSMFLRQRAFRFASPVLVAAVVATVFWVSAGDLDPPPGAIQPTNRVQINAQSVTLPYTITDPGSYILTSNLTGTPGNDGILIDASDVTLDLNGFALVGYGAEPDGDGIRVNDPQIDITVRNGTIRGWFGNGIYAPGVENARFDSLTITDNGNDGIVVGSSSAVRALTITGIGQSGIHVVGNANRIEGNHVTASSIGIDIDGANNIIVKNTASSNGTDYDIADGNAYGPIAYVGGIGDISAVANAIHPWANFALTCVPSAEICDGIDNDCDPGTADGWDEPWLGDPCDGTDTDLCEEGTYGCSAGSQTCSDNTSDNLDLCNGADDDCDPTSTDGSEDPLLGASCDGPDSDLCAEGTYNGCSAGSLTCSDSTGSTVDLCDGLDNDCDPASADGSEDPLLGALCDGPDSDLCAEGTYNGCSAGTLTCSDTSGDTLDLCDRVDNDCDPASADGSEEPWIGLPCDGYDTDLCQEGTYSCSGGYQTCSDNTGSTVDLCDGADNDCDPASADGSEDPLIGTPCDGPDSDLCAEGTYNGCSAGTLTCSDTSGDTLDLCDGTNEDCDPASPDGSEEPWFGDPCDGPDTDFCEEGTYGCSAGSQTCSDTTGNNVEICNGSDDDCDTVVDEGACPNGTACTSYIICQSGNCVDDVCCNTSCTGLCEACDLAGTVGSCTPVPLATDPDEECPGSEVCNGVGDCCQVNGTSCVINSDCCSGNCDAGTSTCQP